MTEYQWKIVFVLVLCAPIVYFGIRFFISLVNNAVAGKKIPEDKGRDRNIERGRNIDRGRDMNRNGRR